MMDQDKKQKGRRPGGPALPPREKTRQSTLRLVISVPVLLVLFTLIYGLFSYLFITSKWSGFESRGVDDIGADLLQGHMIAMIVLSILAFGAGLVLVYTILRPIRAMEATARRIIEGHLDQRAPTITSGHELGSLSRSFNSMIDFLNECIEDRNRYMVEGIKTGVLFLDLDGRIKALNATGARLLGIDSADAVGSKVGDLRGRMSSGEDFWFDLDQALRTNLSELTDEIVMESSIGGVSLMVAISVLRDSKQVPFGLMLNFRDAGEMRTLKEQLNKADQLAALGTFTMGLAHELRNPLGSIKGMIQLLALEKPATADSREIIERVVREVNRLDQFVRELLDFSHDAPTPPEEFDLAQILRQSMDQVRGQFDAQAAGGMHVRFDVPELPRLVGEPDRLVQAFSNIMRNAFEAARPGSGIWVRATLETRKGGDAIVLHLGNSGSTIKANDLGKIFDPFFSTKEKGNGLGLAIAYQILTQNGAHVDLDVGADEVDFIITFPVKTPGAFVGASGVDEPDSRKELGRS